MSGAHPRCPGCHNQTGVEDPNLHPGRNRRSELHEDHGVVMAERRVCGAQGSTRLFTRYDHGAQFAEDEDGNELVLFVACQREAGHAGNHVAIGVGDWTDDLGKPCG